jgi:hypothetical protein
MARIDRVTSPAEERMRAVERLDAAVGERTRLRLEFEAARGTPHELEANAAMLAADEQAEARGRWLKWADDGDY